MHERAHLWLENLQDEREGARLYEGLAEIEKDAARAREFASLGAGERRHATVWERKLRAAVFGMNDGLVSNLALVLGVAAAGAGGDALILTGIAGLLAGAFSMAV